jgi:hypothetical protein
VENILLEDINFFCIYTNLSSRHFFNSNEKVRVRTYLHICIHIKHKMMMLGWIIFFVTIRDIFYYNKIYNNF